jgi:hypothetical protein
MATSGSFSNTFKTGWTLVVEWTESNVDTANNQSDITVTAKLKTASGYTIDSSASKNISLTINGTTYSSTCTVGVGSGTTKTLWSKTVSNINHNSDGAKTISITCKLAIAVTLSGQYISSVSATGSAKLTTIARKSSMSVGDGTLGAAQTLTVTRQSSSFTHTITAKCGSASTTICTKSTSTSISFTPPLSWASQNTTGTSVSVTYTITTYNGSTSLGSNTYTKTCSIPSSVKPSVSFTVSDANNYLATYGGYVQSKSKFKIVITASGSQSSTIKSYKTTVDGKTYTSSSITTDVISGSGSGTLTINVTVTDSRGRTATASKTVSVLAYTPPKISSMSVIRSDATGKSSSSGAYLTVKFKSTVTTLNNKNSATYTIEYKKTTESQYTKVTLVDFKDNYNVDGSYTFVAATSNSYNVLLTVTDGFEPVKKIGVGKSVFKFFSFLKKGTGMAIGKIAELANVLDIGFQTRFSGGIMAVVAEKITDLNDLKTPNTYVSVNNSASTYANLPSGLSGTFTIEVLSAGAEGQIMQRITKCSKESPAVYIRHFYQGEWDDDWNYFYNSEWENLTLGTGVSLGNDAPYLKGRIVNDVLYITGSVKGVTTNWKQVAVLPSSLKQRKIIRTRFPAVYDMSNFCGAMLDVNGNLWVTTNSTGSWDSTKEIHFNSQFCLDDPA